MANYVKQLKDNDGNNIYPIAYTQGGMKIDLLWTNPSPTSSFAAQTISLDLSEYDMVAIDARFSATYQNFIGLVYAKVGDVNLRLQGQVGGKMIQRAVSAINADGIVIDVGSTYSTYGSAATTDNTAMIPYKIYGLKMSYIVPTQVHGLQYVEVE